VPNRKSGCESGIRLVQSFLLRIATGDFWHSDMKRTVRRPEEATDRLTELPTGFGRFLAKRYLAATEKKALLIEKNVTYTFRGRTYPK
jgi:hypothetical protein